MCDKNDEMARRAVLGTLLEAHWPLTVGEVVDAIRAAGCTTYAPIRSAIPTTTQWRCRHWRDGLNPD